MISYTKEEVRVKSKHLQWERRIPNVVPTNRRRKNAPVIGTRRQRQTMSRGRQYRHKRPDLKIYSSHSWSMPKQVESRTNRRLENPENPKIQPHFSPKFFNQQQRLLDMHL